jgi:hypothetical protein
MVMDECTVNQVCHNWRSFFMRKYTTQFIKCKNEDQK